MLTLLTKDDTVGAWWDAVNEITMFNSTGFSHLVKGSSSFSEAAERANAAAELVGTAAIRSGVDTAALWVAKINAIIAANLTTSLTPPDWDLNPTDLDPALGLCYNLRERPTGGCYYPTEPTSRITPSSSPAKTPVLVWDGAHALYAARQPPEDFKTLSGASAPAGRPIGNSYWQRINIPKRTGYTTAFMHKGVTPAPEPTKSVCRFNGVDAYGTAGDVWQTQNPCVYAEFCMTGRDDDYRWIMGRRSGITDEREYQMYVTPDNLLRLMCFNNSAENYVAESIDQLSLDTDYEAMGYYDRANSKLLLRYRERGATTWIELETTGVPALTLSGATLSSIGGASWANLPFEGSIRTVIISDYATSEILGNVDFTNQFGKDWAANPIDGVTLTPGASGLPYMCGTRIEDPDGVRVTPDHYPITDPGSVMGKTKSVCRFNGVDAYGVLDTKITESSGTLLLKMSTNVQPDYGRILGTLALAGGVNLTYHAHPTILHPYFNTSLGYSGVVPLDTPWYEEGVMKHAIGIWDFDGENTTVTTYLPEHNFWESSVYAGQIPISPDYISIMRRTDGYDYMQGMVAWVQAYDRALSRDEIDNVIADRTLYSDNRIVDADFTDQLGKSWAANPIDGVTFTPGASGLDYMCGKRIADADGAIVAADFNPAPNTDEDGNWTYPEDFNVFGVLQSLQRQSGMVGANDTADFVGLGRNSDFKYVAAGPWKWDNLVWRADASVEYERYAIESGAPLYVVLCVGLSPKDLSSGGRELVQRLTGVIINGHMMDFAISDYEHTPPDGTSPGASFITAGTLPQASFASTQFSDPQLYKSCDISVGPYAAFGFPRDGAGSLPVAGLCGTLSNLNIPGYSYWPLEERKSGDAEQGYNAAPVGGALADVSTRSAQAHTEVAAPGRAVLEYRHGLKADSTSITDEAPAPSYCADAGYETLGSVTKPNTLPQPVHTVGVRGLTTKTTPDAGLSALADIVGFDGPIFAEVCVDITRLYGRAVVLEVQRTASAAKLQIVVDVVQPVPYDMSAAKHPTFMELFALSVCRETDGTSEVAVEPIPLNPFKTYRVAVVHEGGAGATWTHVYLNKKRVASVLNPAGQDVSDAGIYKIKSQADNGVALFGDVVVGLAELEESAPEEFELSQTKDAALDPAKIHFTYPTFGEHEPADLVVTPHRLDPVSAPAAAYDWGLVAEHDPLYEMAWAPEAADTAAADRFHKEPLYAVKFANYAPEFESAAPWWFDAGAALPVRAADMPYIEDVTPGAERMVVRRSEQYGECAVESVAFYNLNVSAEAECKTWASGQTAACPTATP